MRKRERQRVAHPIKTKIRGRTVRKQGTRGRKEKPSDHLLDTRAPVKRLSAEQASRTGVGRPGGSRGQWNREKAARTSSCLEAFFFQLTLTRIGERINIWPPRKRTQEGVCHQLSCIRGNRPTEGKPCQKIGGGEGKTNSAAFTRRSISKRPGGGGGGWGRRGVEATLLQRGGLQLREWASFRGEVNRYTEHFGELPQREKSSEQIGAICGCASRRWNLGDARFAGRL